MQCAAIAIRTGRRCQRMVVPGTRYCRFHHDARVGDAEEVTAVRGDAPLQSQVVMPIPGDTPVGIGVEDEIVMLRRQIREADQMGDPEAVRRGIETLLKALKVQHVLAGRSAESLADSLAKVLEEVGAELGTAL